MYKKFLPWLILKVSPFTPLTKLNHIKRLHLLSLQNISYSCEISGHPSRIKFFTSSPLICCDQTVTDTTMVVLLVFFLPNF